MVIASDIEDNDEGMGISRPEASKQASSGKALVWISTRTRTTTSNVSPGRALYSCTENSENSPSWEEVSFHPSRSSASIRTAGLDGGFQVASKLHSKNAKCTNTPRKWGQ